MKIAVIGVGYIGTIISQVISSNGFEVIGVDSSKKNIDKLSKGKCDIQEPGLEKLLKKNKSKIKYYSDYSYAKDCDVFLVTVGTPLTKNLKANLSEVKNVAKCLAPILKDKAIVCLKSTVLPGTTEEFCKIISNNFKKKIGKNFYLAFSPERLAEGNAINEFKNLPIVVGSDDKESIIKVCNFWKKVLNVKTLKINTYKGAELTKLANNLWIDQNIALANNLAMICSQYEIDVNQVITAANSLPKGKSFVNILNSSIGVGGHCLTKDPLFVANLLDDLGYSGKMIREARKINNLMPRVYINKIYSFIKSNKLNVKKISMIGLSFKSDTNDLRYSPMIDIFKILFRKFDIMTYDPIVSSDDFSNAVGKKINHFSLKNCLIKSEIIIFGCAHKNISKIQIEQFLSMNKNKLVLFVDGRHAYRNTIKLKKNISYMAI